MEGHAKNDLFFYTDIKKCGVMNTVFCEQEQFLNFHGSGCLLYKTLSFACQKQSTSISIQNILQ